jgi:DNA-binding LacI/PurR family transcriptional regulator
LSNADVGLLSTETRVRVEQAIDELGYRPDPLHRRTSATATIGLPVQGIARLRIS